MRGKKFLLGGQSAGLWPAQAACGGWFLFLIPVRRENVKLEGAQRRAVGVGGMVRSVGIFTPERGKFQQNGFAGQFCASKGLSRDVGVRLALWHSRGQPRGQWATVAGRPTLVWGTGSSPPRLSCGGREREDGRPSEVVSTFSRASGVYREAEWPPPRDADHENSDNSFGFLNAWRAPGSVTKCFACVDSFNLLQPRAGV